MTSPRDNRVVHTTVSAIKYVRKTPNGNNIFELTTAHGVFNTSSDSRAGTRLTRREFNKPRKAKLILTPRGTIRDFRGEL